MRFASRLIVNYDGDTAGRTAAARAVPLCFEKGLNVEVLVLPDDLDPDAFLRKHGRDHYLAAAEEDRHRARVPDRRPRPGRPR